MLCSFQCIKTQTRHMYIVHLFIDIDRSICLSLSFFQAFVSHRICNLRTARRHQAGTSCRPFSRRGSRLGLLDTESLALLAWIGLRVTLQEGDITQENVESFCCDLLVRFLSPFYYIDRYVGDPTYFGWPVARPRQYLRLRHREKVLAELSPLSTFAKRFWRAIEFEWTQLVCFHKEMFFNQGVRQNEITEELMWAQGRPNSRAHGRAPVTMDDDQPFLQCLTESEDICWRAYKARWPGTAGQLNQDAMSGHGSHSSPMCCKH